MTRVTDAPIARTAERSANGFVPVRSASIPVKAPSSIHSSVRGTTTIPELSPGAASWARRGRKVSIANWTKPMMRATEDAATIVGDLNRLAGMSPSRRSKACHTKASSASAPATSEAHHERSIPRRSSVSPDVMRMLPRESNRRASDSRGRLLSFPHRSRPASTIIGRMAAKAQRHETPMSAPPISGPSPAAVPYATL